jgi:hypothetical protein
MVVSANGGCKHSTQAELEHGRRNSAYAKTMECIRYNLLQRHALFSLSALVNWDMGLETVNLKRYWMISCQ